MQNSSVYPIILDGTECSGNQRDKTLVESYGEEGELVDNTISKTKSDNVKGGINSNYSERVAYNNIDIDSHDFADSNSIDTAYDHIKNIQQSVKDSVVSQSLDNVGYVSSGGSVVSTSSNNALITSDPSEEPTCSDYSELNQLIHNNSNKECQLLYQVTYL